MLEQNENIEIDNMYCLDCEEFIDNEKIINIEFCETHDVVLTTEIYDSFEEFCNINELSIERYDIKKINDLLNSHRIIYKNNEIINIVKEETIHQKITSQEFIKIYDELYKLHDKFNYELVNYLGNVYFNKEKEWYVLNNNNDIDGVFINYDVEEKIEINNVIYQDSSNLITYDKKSDETLCKHKKGLNKGNWEWFVLYDNKTKQFVFSMPSSAFFEFYSYVLCDMQNIYSDAIRFKENDDGLLEGFYNFDKIEIYTKSQWFYINDKFIILETGEIYKLFNVNDIPNM